MLLSRIPLSPPTEPAPVRQRASSFNSTLTQTFLCSKTSKRRVQMKLLQAVHSLVVVLFLLLSASLLYAASTQIVNALARKQSPRPQFWPRIVSGLRFALTRRHRSSILRAIAISRKCISLARCSPTKNTESLPLMRREMTPAPLLRTDMLLMCCFPIWCRHSVTPLWGT